MELHEQHGRGAGAVNFAAGATVELARQGGAAWAANVHTSGLASAAGQHAVRGAANLAPQAVAAAGAVVAAMPAVVAVVAVPAAILGAGFCAWKLVRWLAED